MAPDSSTESTHPSRRINLPREASSRRLKLLMDVHQPLRHLNNRPLQQIRLSSHVSDAKLAYYFGFSAHHWGDCEPVKAIVVVTLPTTLWRLKEAGVEVINSRKRWAVPHMLSEPEWPPAKLKSEINYKRQRSNASLIKQCFFLRTLSAARQAKSAKTSRWRNKLVEHEKRHV